MDDFTAGVMFGLGGLVLVYSLLEMRKRIRHLEEKVHVSRETEKAD